MYKQVQKDYWTVDEVDLTRDARDWARKLSAGERYFVLQVLTLNLECPSNELVAHLAGDAHAAEVRTFFAFQNML